MWWITLSVAVLSAGVTSLCWLLFSNYGAKNSSFKDGKNKGEPSYPEAAESDIEHIFNDQFREELRNRGRLHFEKIIGENAMFLQQDLRLTTSQLNEYMKQEISKKLREEFAKYEQAVTDAKQIAIDSIQKTNQAVEEERQILSAQVKEAYVREKERMMKQFESNLADIINHYVLAAIGDQIDLSDQLEYILADLENNKQALLEDITNGT